MDDAAFVKQQKTIATSVFDEYISRGAYYSSRFAGQTESSSWYNDNVSWPVWYDDQIKERLFLNRPLYYPDLLKIDYLLAKDLYQATRYLMDNTRAGYDHIRQLFSSACVSNLAKANPHIEQKIVHPNHQYISKTLSRTWELNQWSVSQYINPAQEQGVQKKIQKVIDGGLTKVLLDFREEAIHETYKGQPGFLTLGIDPVTHNRLMYE